MTIRGDHIERHSLDVELDEQRRADMGDTLKLKFSWANRHDRIDLPVDGDDLVPSVLDMFDEQKPFRKVIYNGEVILKAIDDEATRHPAEHLFRDKAVGMRVIPEESRPLATVGRDVHFVLEALARVNVDKDIIAVPSRRDSHAMEMQVARIIG